jgi:hypothetical protein
MLGHTSGQYTHKKANVAKQGEHTALVLDLVYKALHDLTEGLQSLSSQ